MPDTIGSLARRAAAAACLILTCAAHSAAQEPLAETPATGEFFSRFDFHLAAAGMASPDDRFSWDTKWGGDFDLVDYVHGRVSFLADYEALGARPLYCQEAANPATYRPYPLAQEFDVTFVGQSYGDRADLVMWLRASGVAADWA